VMSTTPQASLWAPVSYSDSTHHPVYMSSMQEASMPLNSVPTHEKVYHNQNQFPQQANPSQGYVLTPSNMSVPLPSINENPSAIFYAQAASQAAYSVYHCAELQTELMTTPGYEIQAPETQQLPYSEHQFYTLAEQPYPRISLNSLGYESEMLQSKLVQHKSCIDMLMKLEANFEMLSKETFEQSLEITKLENSCTFKDNIIAVLKQERSNQESKIGKLNNDSKKKGTSTEVNKSLKVDEPKKIEIPIPNMLQFEQSASNDELFKAKTSDTMMQELVRLRLENRDIIRLQAKLCKVELSHDELKQIKEENLSQRHEIAQLERRLQTFETDSGISSISRDVTSFGESSSDYTNIVDMDAKSQSTVRDNKL